MRPPRHGVSTWERGDKGNMSNQARGEPRGCAGCLAGCGAREDVTGALVVRHVCSHVRGLHALCAVLCFAFLENTKAIVVCTNLSVRWQQPLIGIDCIYLRQVGAQIEQRKRSMTLVHASASRCLRTKACHQEGGEFRTSARVRTVTAASS